MFLFTDEIDSTTTAVADYRFKFTVNINGEGNTALSVAEIVRGTVVVSEQHVMLQLLQTSGETRR